MIVKFLILDVMEAELILLSRVHLEIIFMLSSCTEVLKNWLLFLTGNW